MNITSQLLIVLAASLWGLVGLVTRPLSAVGFSLFQIAAGRCTITSVCLFTFLLLTDRKKAKVKARHIPFFAIVGCGFMLSTVSYFNAIEMITMSAASIILYTAPCMVIIMAAFVFKEKITRQKVCALLIAFSGCVMTIGVIDSDQLSALGVMSSLASAFFYALHTILCKIALRYYSSLTINAYVFGMASIPLIFLCDFPGLIALAGADTSNIINLFILGIFITIIPFTSYTKGLEKLEPGKVSIIAFIEPLTATVAGLIVYSELLTPVKLLGMVFIFISIIILNLRRTKKS